MSLFIQPQSLFKLSKAIIYKLLIKACVKIEQKYGSYDNESCKEQVNHLRAYFINHISNAMDEFSNTAAGRSWCLRELVDKRIFISLFMHAKTSNYSNIFIRNLYIPTTGEGEKQYLMYMEFFEHRLPFMKNIVNLDLKNIRDVHLLFEVIGQNCHELKELKMDSMKDIIKRNNNLLHLVHCPKLHRIDDEDYFTNYEKAVIKKFITLKPNLTFFNVHSLGEILSTEVENVPTHLSFRYAFENNATPEQILNLFKYCKGLEYLTMFNYTYPEPHKTLNTLSECSFPLKHLSFFAYSVHKIINTVIKTSQCELLKSLTIEDSMPEGNNGVTKWEIMIIGKYCKHLTELELFVGRRHNQEIERYNYDFAEEDGKINDPDYPLFTNLQSLTLHTGINFKQGVVLLCLKNATQIQKISLRDRETSDWLNTGGALVNLENSMTSLEYLYLNCPFVRLSIYDVSALYNKFSHVEAIEVLIGFMEEDGRARVEEICNLIGDNNYNMDFDVMTYDDDLFLGIIP